MKSHELLRVVFKKHGCKRIASELNLSLSLIHKWTEPTGDHGSGELNRLLEAYAAGNQNDRKPLVNPRPARADLCPWLAVLLPPLFWPPAPEWLESVLAFGL